MLFRSMAADDELDAEDLDAEGFMEEGEDEAEGDLEFDEDALDEEDLDDVEGDEGESPATDEDEDETAAAARPRRTAEDEDEDLTTADDVEADLAHILDERLRERSEDEEGEEEEEELPANVDPETSIQPRRPDERMCPQCFLLVRKSAPSCPVGDDACPLITS